MLAMRSQDADTLFGSDPIGVAGFMTFGRVLPGVGAASGDVTFTALASTKQAIQSLGTDITGLTRTMRADSLSFGDLVALKVQYDQFQAEFEGWYAVASDPTVTGSSDVRGSLPNYQQRYREFRQRFIQLGGKPSMTLVLDETASTDWTSLVKWGVVGLGLIVIAPIVLGVSFRP